MRVLLTGGGTAGHINPALAIAETVRLNDPAAEIAFVGVKGGKEEDLVPREGYPLSFVESQGIRRSLSLSNIKAVWLALYSPYSRKTVNILKEFKPDIVIGTGGYACWPLMAAAARMKIPTALHESNAKPGMAIRRLQGRVDRIWTNFEVTAQQLKCPEKVLRVGNPLRGGFSAISYEEARSKLGIRPEQKLILSFGGSLGAEEVNKASIALMKDFVKGNPDLLQIHASGKRDAAESRKQYAEAGLTDAGNCNLVDYIYDMPLRMAAADLVICRAGAMTLSELARMKKAAILIPSPYVADNHQFCNAKALSDAGAAFLLEEKTLSGGSLTETVKSLLNQPGTLETMRRNIEAFAGTDANRLIWEEIRKLVSEGKTKGKQ